MNSRNTLLIGALLAGTAVALGAFGAHALKPLLLANDRVDVYDTAVRFQTIHGLALLFAGLLTSVAGNSRPLQNASLCWLGGTVLFSGSLYGLSVTSVKAFAYATPVGGLLFLAGWLLLIIAILRHKKEPEGS